MATLVGTILVPIHERSVVALLVLAWGTLTFCYLIYRSLLPKPLPDIPYSKTAASSFLGNLLDIQAYRNTHNNNLIPWFSHEATKLNSPVCQFWFGPLQKPGIILQDAREAQDILLRRTREFSSSIVSEDPRYKKNKELVRDLMSPSFLEQVNAPEVYVKTHYLIQYWETKMELSKGQPFEAKTDVFAALHDVLCSAAFTLGQDDSLIRNWHQYLLDAGKGQNDGRSSVVHQNADGTVDFARGGRVEYYEAMKRLSDHLGAQVQAALPKLEHIFKYTTDPGLRKAYRDVHSFEKEQITRSLRRPNSGDDVHLSALDRILSREKQIAEKDGRKPDFYSKRVYDELTGYYSAGHETSASTSSWAVKRLTAYPDIQAKLRSVLREAIPAAVGAKRQPSVLEIMKTSIPYLDAFVEEVLRHHPSLVLQNRETIVDTTILGYSVPKGTTVWIIPEGPSYKGPYLPVSDHLRSQSSREKGQKLWADTAQDLGEFRPERWLKHDEAEGVEKFDNTAAPMQTFGGGPRACFGRRLAYMQLKTLVTLLVWNFELLPLEGDLNNFVLQELVVAQPLNCFIKLRPTHIVA